MFRVMFLRRSAFGVALVAWWSIAWVNAIAHKPGAAAEPVTSAQMAVANYAYQIFPQRLAAAERRAALAEYEAALWQQRVRAFEPMRGFGASGATYFAEQSALLKALAAQERAIWARQQVANVWRERQAVVVALMQQTDWQL